MGVTVNNPVQKISRPTVRNSNTRFLTTEEAQKLLDIAKTSKNKKLYPYLLVMMHTGMRPSEAAGLKWGDVDLENRLVKLHVTKTDMRFVPLTEQAESVLRSIVPDEIKNEMYVFLPEKSAESEYLGKVPCKHFRRSFDNARNNAGLGDVRLHDLRHTAASHLLMAGVDLRTLAEILGHKTRDGLSLYAPCKSTQVKGCRSNKLARS